MSNIGIDLGNVFTSKFEPFPHVFPNAFEVVNQLVKLFNNTYIISRVNDKQRERAKEWFKAIDFFNKTGIKEENVYFCFDRRDKAIFIKGLNIDYFIDDRADVMRHLPEKTIKLLFNPTKDLDIINNLKYCHVVNNWAEIAKYFRLTK